MLADADHFFMFGASNRDYYWESGRVNLHSVVVEGLFGSDDPRQRTTDHDVEHPVRLDQGALHGRR